MSDRVELPSIEEMLPEHLFRQQSQTSTTPFGPDTPSQLHRNASLPFSTPSPHARNQFLQPLQIPPASEAAASGLAVDLPSRRRHTVTQTPVGLGNVHATIGGSRFRSPSLPNVGSHFYQKHHTSLGGMTAGPSALSPSLLAYHSAPTTSHRFASFPPSAYPSPQAYHGPPMTPPELSDYESSSIHSSDTDAEGDDAATPVARRVAPIGELRAHECDLCGRRFDRPSSLRTHYNTHTGSRPYACPYPSCTQVFSVKSNMRRHYRNHFTPLPEERPGQIVGSRVFRLDRWQGGAAPGPHPPQSTHQSSFVLETTPPQLGPSQ